MIPALAIAHWGNTVPWPSADQLEQDLTLARLIVEIANDPYLGDELVFRGGTCLHKLHLFDLWLALTRLEIPPADILTSFAPYRPEKYTGTLAIANLQAKVHDRAFRQDLDALVGRWPDDYDIDHAAALISQQLLSHLD